MGRGWRARAGRHAHAHDAEQAEQRHVRSPARAAQVLGEKVAHAEEERDRGEEGEEDLERVGRLPGLGLGLGLELGLGLGVMAERKARRILSAWGDCQLRKKK